MSAVPLTVVSESLPASRKIFARGRIHPQLRVPMREISLHPSAAEAPLIVYDSSGPYTDPAVRIDIEKGLPRLREEWILARGDVAAGEGRPVRPEDNGLTASGAGAPAFPVQRRPLKAKGGSAVTQ